MLICLLPFAGMSFFSTETTTENRTLAVFPSVTGDDGLNKEFFDEFSEYFEDHFAFRNLFVEADAQIQSKVFKTSNNDSVVVGTDDWLYYSSTVDDYLGADVLSDRGAFSVAYNISLLQQFVENKGADFAFTVAPNKNSLYGENMPYYYSYTVSDEKNIDKIEKYLDSENVNYIDLYQAFERSDETLYLQRDSHWNNKGAVLAYNTILDCLNIEHDDLSSTKVTRAKDKDGDLYQMLFPLSQNSEWDYQYDYDVNYKFMLENSTVEDSRSDTTNSSGSQSLLMFRDSFGNTLLPLMANTFESARFLNIAPYTIEEELNSYSPDTVIVERVERFIDEYLTTPPVMSGILVDNIQADTADSDTSLSVQECSDYPDYYEFSGSVDESHLETESKIYIEITSGDTTKTYCAFNISNEDCDNGYLLYLDKSMLTSSNLTVNVIVESGDSYTSVCRKTIKL